EFGLHYRYYNFSFGIALPSLFNSSYTNNELDPFKEVLVTTSSTFPLSANLELEPHLTYRMGENFSGQFEGTGLVRFYDAFWVGASYRQYYGASGLVGFKASPLFRLGYAYELASSQVSGYSNGSHEIHLNLSFGEVKKKPKSRLPR